MDANEIATLVSELEDRVERLRALYDQYFVGIERLEPLILRKDVDRRIWQLRREPIRNTALRFKLQTVIQRYNTHQQHWQRICREIENGTYFRDVSRAAARFGDVALTAMGRKRQKMFQKGASRRAERDSARAAPGPPTEPSGNASLPPVPESAAASASAQERPGADESKWSVAPAAPITPIDPPLGLDLESLSDLAPLAEKLIDALDRGGPPPGEEAAEVHPQTLSDLAPFAEQLIDSLDRDAPARPPVTRGSPQSLAAQPRRPPDKDALNATRLRELYGSYVEARRRCHESTAGITFERLSANLKRTADVLRAKHPGRQIAFEVVIKNGTAVLKALVKG